MSRQIIAKDNDLEIISKIFEFLAERHEIERSTTFLEINDANGREFRYVSMNDDWPNESPNRMKAYIASWQILGPNDLLEARTGESKMNPFFFVVSLHFFFYRSSHISLDKKLLFSLFSIMTITFINSAAVSFLSGTILAFVKSLMLRLTSSFRVWLPWRSKK